MTVILAHYKKGLLSHKQVVISHILQIENRTLAEAIKKQKKTCFFSQKQKHTVLCNILNILFEGPNTKPFKLQPEKLHTIFGA